MISILKYQLEKLEDIYDEILPILKEHYLEIAHYKDIKFEPNISEYYRLEDIGIIKIYTVREESELIGYAVFIIKSHLHYKSSLTAGQDILYIKKEKRGFGRDFINWCDGELKKLGVQVVYQHVKANHDFGSMLETLDYKLVDKLYGRRLDK